MRRFGFATRLALGLACFALAACSDGGSREAAAGPPDLETAAIERGLVVDPATVELAGLFARENDRVCITGAPGRYRIGAFADYGDDQTCSASGRVEQRGDTLRIELGDGCRFDARYDGSRIAFPGALPPECAARCRSRALFEGLLVERLSDSQSEAAALRDPAGRLLCGAAT